MDERAGGGGALLARVDEGGGHQRGDDLVEVGVGVHDHAVLAAHLGDHALEVLLAGADLRRLLDDLQADGARAGEGDRVHARVLDQRGADLALAGEQGDGVGGDAALAQRAEEHQRAAGRLLGGLEHDGVARWPARRRSCPSGIASGKFQGEMTRDDAAGRVAHRVALAGDLQQRRALGDVDRAARRSTRGSRSPRTRRRRPPATASRTRGRRARRPPAGARAATAAARSSASRALLGGRLGPRPRRAGRGGQRAVDLVGRGGGGARHHALRVARVGGDDLLALAPVLADPHRHARAPARASCSRMASASRARTGARRSSRTGSLANSFKAP